MAHTLPIRCVELGDIEAFDDYLRLPASDSPLVIQGLDLLDRDRDILGRPWSDATFLGCRLTAAAEAHVLATAGTVFPPFDGLPYNPYRGELYSTAELAADDLDGRIHRHQASVPRNGPAPILEALAQRIHDHAIDDALDDYLAAHGRVVAIMGGHSLLRGDDTYRAVAIVARLLTRAGYLVVTGGGPGAMEAGNLGAWLAPHTDDALDEALMLLGEAVDYSTDEYGRAGAEVTRRYPDGADSLAIPTWFYGHEPTNAFATAVAKYFSNSIREDGLLAIATHGVVYAPGAAGTVQEVFMDATQNHYGVFGVISPMVFLDSSYWEDERLCAPRLLRQLAGDRPYADAIAVLDAPEAVVAFIDQHPPAPAV